MCEKKGEMKKLTVQLIWNNTSANLIGTHFFSNTHTTHIYRLLPIVLHLMMAICHIENSCEGTINKILDTNNQLILTIKILKFLSIMVPHQKNSLLSRTSIHLYPEAILISRLVYTNKRCISSDHTATLAPVQPKVRM